MPLGNTLPYPPGCYEIEADWPDGWTHRIRFIKFNEGFPKIRLFRPASAHRTPRHTWRRSAFTARKPGRTNSKPSVNSIRPKPNEELYFPSGNVRMVQNDHEYRLYDSNDVEMDSGFDHGKLKQEIFAKFARTLEYAQDGRGGSIYYKEGKLNIHLTGNSAVVTRW